MSNFNLYVSNLSRVLRAQLIAEQAALARRANIRLSIVGEPFEQNSRGELNQGSGLQAEPRELTTLAQKLGSSER